MRRTFSTRTTSQVTAFTSWINHQLKTGNYPPITTHLCDAFRDGCVLANLYHVFAGEKLKVRPSPHPAICRANIEKVLSKFEKIPRLRLSEYSADEFYTGREYPVINFIWQLVLGFDESVQGLSMAAWVERETQKERAREEKERLNKKREKLSRVTSIREGNEEEYEEKAGGKHNEEAPAEESTVTLTPTQTHIFNSNPNSRSSHFRKWMTKSSPVPKTSGARHRVSLNPNLSVKLQQTRQSGIGQAPQHPGQNYLVRLSPDKCLVHL